MMLAPSAHITKPEVGTAFTEGPDGEYLNRLQLAQLRAKTGLALQGVWRAAARMQSHDVYVAVQRTLHLVNCRWRRQGQLIESERKSRNDERFGKRHETPRKRKQARQVIVIGRPLRMGAAVQAILDD